MKKIKWLLLYIVLMMIPVIVHADNEFGLSEDYLYYCKYDFVTMINGGGKLEEEAERHFPFYVYVYQNELVPIIKYEHLPEFYNMNNFPMGEVIINLGDATTAKYTYTSLDNFFDKEQVNCPTLYISSDGYTDFITGYSSQKSKAYKSVESKKGNLGNNLGEVTFGKKYTITYHFTSEGNLSEIKDTTIKANFFYNSKGEKCLEVAGITDCQEDPSHILVPIQMVKNGSNQGYNPENPCKGDNCNISLDSFCAMPTVARTLKFLGLLFVIVKILVPAIIIILGFYNLFQIISSGKYEDAKKYTTNIVKRVLTGVLIFLLPTIVQFIFQTASDFVNDGNEGTFDNCVTCIMDPDECEIETND